MGGNENEHEGRDMAHTKGTWHMEGPQLVGNGYGIGHVTAHNTSEGKANAALITAAPELLEALEALELYVTNNLESNYPTGVDVNSTQFDKARAAISRAKGGV